MNSAAPFLASVILAGTGGMAWHCFIRRNGSMPWHGVFTCSIPALVSHLFFPHRFLTTVAFPTTPSRMALCHGAIACDPPSYSALAETVLPGVLLAMGAAASGCLVGWILERGHLLRIPATRAKAVSGWLPSSAHVITATLLTTACIHFASYHRFVMRYVPFFATERMDYSWWFPPTAFVWTDMASAMLWNRGAEPRILSILRVAAGVMLGVALVSFFIRLSRRRQRVERVLVYLTWAAMALCVGPIMLWIHALRIRVRTPDAANFQLVGSMQAGLVGAAAVCCVGFGIVLLLDRRRTIESTFVAVSGLVTAIEILRFQLDCATVTSFSEEAAGWSHLCQMFSTVVLLLVSGAAVATIVAARPPAKMERTGPQSRRHRELSAYAMAAASLLVFCWALPQARDSTLWLDPHRKRSLTVVERCNAALPQDVLDKLPADPARIVELRALRPGHSIALPVKLTEEMRILVPLLKAARSGPLDIVAERVQWIRSGTIGDIPYVVERCSAGQVRLSYGQDAQPMDRAWTVQRLIEESNRRPVNPFLALEE